MKSKPFFIASLIVIILGVVFSAAILFWRLVWPSISLKIKEARPYQAVFLKDGLVLFGKLSRPTSAFPTLYDAYRLVITDKGERQIVPIVSESYFPENYVRINREHIAYIEDLKPESPIVGVIKSNSSIRP
jgi:hypothetical protein